MTRKEGGGQGRQELCIPLCLGPRRGVLFVFRFFLFVFRFFLLVIAFLVPGTGPLPSSTAPRHLRVLTFPGPLHTLPAQHERRSAPLRLKNKRYNDENSLASVVLMVAGRGATLYLPPAAEETRQLGTQHGALAPRQRQSERRPVSTLTFARGRGRSACRR